MRIDLTKRQAWRIALLIFAAHTILFVIQVPQFYLYNANNQNPVEWWIPIAKLAWNVYLWAFITPLILWLGLWLPVTRRHLWRKIPHPRAVVPARSEARPGKIRSHSPLHNRQSR